MKTGRVRKKEQSTPEEPKPQAEEAAKKQAPKQASRPKSSVRGAPSKPVGQAPKKPKTPYLIFGIMAAVFVCFIIFVIIMTMRGGADDWVAATRTHGAWTTTVAVFGPQIKVEERWETDCRNDPQGRVQVGSCILKDGNTYRDTVVEDYEEFAYDIYYEEMWDKVYQAQGSNFAETSLGSDDWWEGNMHYTRQEELDNGSCEYTTYTLWVSDRQDSSQEVEVYLAQCEVWDHVVVEERVYDQKSWCQCNLATLVEIGQQSDQGTGLDVLWPNPNLPSGGQSERSFKGQVTFLGDDYAYTTTTDDLSQYRDYLTAQYYIGLRDDKPVAVSKNPDR